MSIAKEGIISRGQEERRLRDMRIEAEGQICREVLNKEKDSINQNRIYYLLKDVRPKLG
jgi:hypothetical protein